MACKAGVMNIKSAWSELEAAMDHLQQIEEKLDAEMVELQIERAKLDSERRLLNEDRMKFEAEKAAMMKLGTGPEDLVGLNFRGEKTMAMKRSLLCQVEGSMFAAMFSGRYEDQLHYDRHGNVFIDYPPSVMVPLMDRLIVRHDSPPDSKLPNIVIPTEYKSMWHCVLRFFGLESIDLLPVVFTGVQQNVKISELRGWGISICKPFSHATSMADFELPGVSNDCAVLVGTRRTGEDMLVAAAMGRIDVIVAQSHDRVHNGVYWTTSEHIITFRNAPLGPLLSQIWEIATGDMMEYKASTIYLYDDDSYGRGWEKIIMTPDQHVKFDV